MSQAGAETSTAGAFSAFASFLGIPLPPDPIDALRRLRHEAAAEVERLIAFLDATDGDPDLEPNGDIEPSLASPESVLPFGDGYWWRQGLWRTGEGRQLSWARGNRADLEGDPNEDDEDSFDREDERADEYSLGWTAAINQDRRNDGDCGLVGDGEQMLASTRVEEATRLASRIDHDGEDGHDREGDPAEDGFADMDSLHDPSCFLQGGGSFGGDGQQIAARLLSEAR